MKKLEKIIKLNQDNTITLIYRMDRIEEEHNKLVDSVNEIIDCLELGDSTK